MMFQGLENSGPFFPSLGNVRIRCYCALMKFLLRSLVLLVCGLVPARAEPALPDLTIFLGAQNNSAGLEVSSAGDGSNVAVDVGGVPARKMAGPRAHYLYARITHPAWTNAPCAAYVSAEVLDEKFGRLQVEYDRFS